MSRLNFPPTPKWSGRNDGFGAERFHQQVQSIELAKVPLAQGREFALLGFCCDEGVKRNGGRIGAALGPEYLRKNLANLAWGPKKPKCIDIGDLLCTDEDLEGAQKELGETVNVLLQKKYTPIVLGGGHETAWGHFQGIAKHCKNPLIINFDAHYDLRPLIDKQWGSSGTPFMQIAELQKEQGRPFNYICIGVQHASNTLSLQTSAEQNKVQTVFAETLHMEGIASTLSLLEKNLAMHDGVYLSVCMDVFAQCYAPGVSAPQALGISPWHVIPLIRKIVASGKLLSADFVELCPPFDQDAQTAKLAASLLWELC